MTFRQQYSVLRQRGGAGREILPGGYLSLCCQRVTGDSHDIAGRVNLAGGILCDVFAASVTSRPAVSFSFC